MRSILSLASLPVYQPLWAEVAEADRNELEVEEGDQLGNGLCWYNSALAPWSQYGHPQFMIILYNLFSWRESWRGRERWLKLKLSTIEFGGTNFSDKTVGIKLRLGDDFFVFFCCDETARQPELHSMLCRCWSGMLDRDLGHCRSMLPCYEPAAATMLWFHGVTGGSKATKASPNYSDGWRCWIGKRGVYYWSSSFQLWSFAGPATFNVVMGLQCTRFSFALEHWLRLLRAGGDDLWGWGCWRGHDLAEFLKVLLWDLPTENSGAARWSSWAFDSNATGKSETQPSENPAGWAEAFLESWRWICCSWLCCFCSWERNCFILLRRVRLPGIWLLILESSAFSSPSHTSNKSTSSVRLRSQCRRWDFGKHLCWGSHFYTWRFLVDRHSHPTSWVANASYPVWTKHQGRHECNGNDQMGRS